jgi:hypothetical protein
MATSSIISTWGLAIPGRETKGLEVFMGAIQWYTQLQEKGEIESFSVHLHETGNATDSGGSLIVLGSDDQINALVDTADYRALVMRAQHIVGNFTITRGVTGDKIMSRIEELNKVRAELGYQ